MRLIARLAIALSALTAPSAFAYTLPAHVIAQVSSGAGFAPATFPVQSGVRIYDNGTVEKFELYRDGRAVTAPLATLAADRVQAILRLSKDLDDKKLVKEDADAPMCMDAPGTTYVAVNGQGLAVALEGEFGCNRYVREDNTGNQVPALLKGLQSLSWL